jgi:hypothetical protein
MGCHQEPYLCPDRSWVTTLLLSPVTVTEGNIFRNRLLTCGWWKYSRKPVSYALQHTRVALNLQLTSPELRCRLDYELPLGCYRRHRHSYPLLL